MVRRCADYESGVAMNVHNFVQDFKRFDFLARYSIDKRSTIERLAVRIGNQEAIVKNPLQRSFVVVHFSINPSVVQCQKLRFRTPRGTNSCAGKKATRGYTQ